MLGGGNAVEGDIWETDDRGRAFLPGEAAGSGSVHGVQGRYGTWVAGGTHAETSWEGSGWETELGNHIPHRGSTYLQDGIPNLRGGAELPR